MFLLGQDNVLENSIIGQYEEIEKLELEV